jgi:hypothetical protein
LSSVFSKTRPYEDLPTSIDLKVTPDSRALFFIYIARVSALATKFDDGALNLLKNTSYKYLIIDGNSKSLLDVCGRMIKITINLCDEVNVLKRSGVDRKAEFERRVEAYCSKVRHPQYIIDAVDVELLKLGYVGKCAFSGTLLPDGRREGTNAEQLSAAIKNLNDPALRSVCTARFEMLAHQIWGWKYPHMTDAIKNSIYEDFNAKQNELSSVSGDGPAGCPNATIRMLWHFQRVNFPYSLEMFKVPVGNDTWAKNLVKLNPAMFSQM